MSLLRVEKPTVAFVMSLVAGIIYLIVKIRRFGTTGLG
jgi:hypothetical protein